VQFTTNLGTFANGSNSFTTQTDASGTAVAVLYAGTTSGDVTVQCSAGGLVAYTYLSFTSQGGATLKLSAVPTTVNADGISFSTITAVLTDSTGSVPKQPISVQFTTNLGTFANGSNSFTTQTDAAGTAVAVLYAGITSGDVTVQCSAGELVAYTYLKFVSSTPGPTADITLSASSASIIADGISSSIITATLKDKDGIPVAIGTAATFTTNLAVFSNNKNNYATTTIDENGTATATLIAGLTPGTATITCTSGSVSRIIKIEIRSF
jgi:adhesin/invasin